MISTAGLAVVVVRLALVWLRMTFLPEEGLTIPSPLLPSTLLSSADSSALLTFCVAAVLFAELVAEPALAR